MALGGSERAKTYEDAATLFCSTGGPSVERERVRELLLFFKVKRIMRQLGYFLGFIWLLNKSKIWLYANYN